MNLNRKAILLIDGDNVSGGMADAVYEAAKEYGRICEAHIFGNFKKIDTDWHMAAYRHALIIHHFPIIISGKNTADIGLTIQAMEKLYTCADIEAYIIAANDTDYMPLAAELRRQGKLTVCLYTKKDNQLTGAYDIAKLVEKKIGDPAQSNERKFAENVNDIIDNNLKNNDKLMLNRLSIVLKDKIKGFSIKKSYKRQFSSLKMLLKQLFTDYPDLFSKYELQTDYIAKKN